MDSIASSRTPIRLPKIIHSEKVFKMNVMLLTVTSAEHTCVCPRIVLFVDLIMDGTQD